MDVSQVPASYTHMHFAFGTLTDDLRVSFEDEYVKYQFEQFKKLRGPNRILSIGGWAFSAEKKYYSTFQKGVKFANRWDMAANIATFVLENGLDGVNIDWGYPGATSAPGIPPTDNDNEGAMYALFLSILRSKLDPSKSLSIAAPASYWYLQNLPIQNMAENLDYIVYMTHDLHDQWDAANAWADSGCPAGNCLRSHVNLTDTLSALSVITKAGVPSKKVIVGVAGYGRSFQMANSSCTGSNCSFIGGSGTGNSTARKGRCTDTAGYLGNVEIREIADSPDAKTWYDKDSDSNIMTYNGDNWVSYMSDAVRDSRTKLYKDYNMGGTANWAMDLNQFHDAPKVYEGSDVDLGWDNIKSNIKNFGQAKVCNLDARTGTWVNLECTKDQVASPFDFTPNDRWKALECGAAWNDAKVRWVSCDRGRITFSNSISQFLHTNENAVRLTPTTSQSEPPTLIAV
ncbi:hypothetical protein QQS21_006476 [Conoideocrella luteorostrata]|uniref:chitinase n=1 Tax=Conoideocrella luteorostrata TaxID=1105319 RepID=A0AAJ0CNA1_9HYPO|nr:hypothetical protein QQS21_006476 [Conoideocrella luteorostrata]